MYWMIILVYIQRGNILLNKDDFTLEYKRYNYSRKVALIKLIKKRISVIRICFC